MEYQANGNDTEIWAYRCVYHGHRGHSTSFLTFNIFIDFFEQLLFFRMETKTVSYMALKRTECVSFSLFWIFCNSHRFILMFAQGQIYTYKLKYTHRLPLIFG